MDLLVVDESLDWPDQMATPPSQVAPHYLPTLAASSSSVEPAVETPRLVEPSSSGGVAMLPTEIVGGTHSTGAWQALLIGPLGIPQAALMSLPLSCR